MALNEIHHQRIGLSNPNKKNSGSKNKNINFQLLKDGQEDTFSELDFLLIEGKKDCQR